MSLWRDDRIRELIFWKEWVFSGERIEFDNECLEGVGCLWRFHLPGKTEPEMAAEQQARAMRHRVWGLRAKEKTSRMEASSGFGGDAVSSLWIAISCSRGVVSSVSTLVVSMVGLILWMSPMSAAILLLFAKANAIPKCELRTCSVREELYIRSIEVRTRTYQKKWRTKVRMDNTR